MMASWPEFHEKSVQDLISHMPSTEKIYLPHAVIFHGLKRKFDSARILGIRILLSHQKLELEFALCVYYVEHMCAAMWPSQEVFLKGSRVKICL